MSLIEKLIQKSKDWTAPQLHEYFWIYEPPIKPFKLPPDADLDDQGQVLEGVITPEQRAREAGEYHKENGHENKNPHHPVHQKKLHDAYNHGYQHAQVKKKISKTERDLKNEDHVVGAAQGHTYNELKVLILRELKACKDEWEANLDTMTEKQKLFLNRCLEFYIQALTMVRAKEPLEKISDLLQHRNPYTKWTSEEKKDVEEDVSHSHVKGPNWDDFEEAVADYFSACFSQEAIGKMARRPEVALKEIAKFLKMVPKGMNAAGVSATSLEDKEAMRRIQNGLVKAYHQFGESVDEAYFSPGYITDTFNPQNPPKVGQEVKMVVIREKGYGAYPATVTTVTHNGKRLTVECKGETHTFTWRKDIYYEMGDKSDFGNYIAFGQSRKVDEAVYDPSWKNIPLKDRSAKQQAAIDAYGKKPTVPKVVVTMQSSGKKWKETFKLQKNDDAETVAKNYVKSLNDMKAKNPGIYPDQTPIELVKFEVK